MYRAPAHPNTPGPDQRSPPPTSPTQPQYTFRPQRASQLPFVPPSLLHSESTNSTYLADLNTVQLPAPEYTSTASSRPCAFCNIPLKDRPRVACFDCPDYELCSECYIYERFSRTHTRSHYQRVRIPHNYPFIPRDRTESVPDTVDYLCDVCGKDLTSQPRARCTVCKNYDLCLDCKIAEQTSLRHRNSHDVNIVHSHYTAPVTPLMDENHVPTTTLLKIIDSLFDYINTSFRPVNTDLLTPPALSGFFSSLGLDSPRENIGRLGNAALRQLYTDYGCEYHVISDRADEIAARMYAWSSDGLDVTPRTPALTRRGWTRWYVLMCAERPDLGHFVTTNALSTGKVTKANGGNWRFGCRRGCFPKRGIGYEGREGRSGGR